ncbi:NACHT domain-containing protein [Acrocarpospora catenulata]|uniref:NACHT domain-containing protein n=1 Tax=Acrocarpospora catenulata TaxID=2836182 RepID=UPI001BDA0765|nr:hypothetical protein [Acrocarpospora catenulata]
MAKPLTYADAVRILGGETKSLRALDVALGGTLIGTAAVGGLPATAAAGALALSLFDAKAEGIRLGHRLVGALRDKITGVSRHTRSERLQAAHAVIVVTAFFEALDDIDLPFGLKDLQLDRIEQCFIFQWEDLAYLLPGGSATTPKRKELKLPGDPANTDLSIVYVMAGTMLLRFCEGLAIWDSLSHDQRKHVTLTLGHKLRVAALARYEDLYLRLAGDFPEFAFWANLREQRSAKEETRCGLGGLADLLTPLASGQVPQPKLHTILTVNKAALGRAIAPGDDLPDGLALPKLADAYVNPAFRLSTGDRDLSLEETWAAESVRDDLQQFLAGWLTSMAATAAPLLVLGQPGVGKSLLTRMLAARLPEADFLPIRVPLRQVPADAGIQEQVEAAIRVTTGETVNWRDIARSVNGARPVILLDGLDELLQATGVNRADYLIQVAEFQAREADMGSPVAVIVTTRTAVADRCRLSPGTLAIRLEPFSDAQVGQWIETWNDTNRSYFERRGRSPLSAENVLAHRELAEQPLLLLMLALYDADPNAGEGSLAGVGQLSRAGLYERLLRRFAAREVAKHEPGLPADAQATAVEKELHRLSIAAFAMFNRGQQWVTHEELDQDLTTLLPNLSPAAGQGFHRPLSAAQTVIGRFFFIHQTRAVQDSQELRTYEFLHSTFGEYLIARLIRGLLRQAVRREALDQQDILGGMTGTRPEPELLGALLSFGVLSTRSPILNFLHETAEQQEELKSLLIRWFQHSYFGTGLPTAEYEPMRRTAVQRLARHTTNLVLLAVVMTGPVTAAKLFGKGEESIWQWQHLVDLWRAGAHGEDEWPSLSETLDIARSWSGQQRELTVFWTGSHITLPPRSVSSELNGQQEEQAIQMTSDTLDWAHNRPPGSDSHRWEAFPAHTSLDIGAGRSVNIEVFARVMNMFWTSGMPYFYIPDFGRSRSAFAIIMDIHLPFKIWKPHEQQSKMAESYDNLPDRLAAYEQFLQIARELSQYSHSLIPLTIDRFALDVNSMPPKGGANILSQIMEILSDNSMSLRDGWTCHRLAYCALALVARDRTHLALLDRILDEPELPQRSHLEAATALIEMEIDPGEAGVTAFEVVRRMTSDDLLKIQTEDPHLYHRARRAIRSDGGRYRLVWPG